MSGLRVVGLVGTISGSGLSQGLRGLQTYCRYNLLEDGGSVLWGVKNVPWYVAWVGGS